MLNSIAYSQATRNVEVYKLKAMGKDLKKCKKVIIPELNEANNQLEELALKNLEIFAKLKILRIENKQYDAQIKKLNEDILKTTKQKKSKGFVFATGGTILGLVIGGLVF